MRHIHAQIGSTQTYKSHTTYFVDLPTKVVRKLSELIEVLNTKISQNLHCFEFRGLLDNQGNVYPLGNDIKVLSTVFELICRPIVVTAVKSLGYEVVEPTVQNQYPDFSLVRGVVKEDPFPDGVEIALVEQSTDIPKIAIDLKTTYRRDNDKFSFTLGSYTSFIRAGNERKNIVFPFNEYVEHLIIGFIYSRRLSQSIQKDSKLVYTSHEYEQVLSPISNIDFFVQKKWRIAGERAGSGNTANIGSISGTLRDFKQGNGPFQSEEEFLTYWRGYERSASARANSYSTLAEFRKFRNND